MPDPAFLKEALARARSATTTPAQRAAAKALSKELAARPPKEVFALAKGLIDAGARHFAYEVLTFHRAARAAWTERDVLAFGRGAASWDVVDHYATTVGGPAWREGVVTDATVGRWTASSDRWERRTALVCTVALNNRARGATAPLGDAARTLRVCKALIADRDDMVVKALSWALRELSKRDSAAVRKFLKEHDATLAPRVKREVRSKLTTGLKNP
jgi:3-methyladenine DNA glycosylase AlkD